MAILMAVNRKKLKRGSESEVQKSSTLPQKGKDFPLVRQPSYAHEDRDPGPVAAFVIEFSSDVLWRPTTYARRFRRTKPATPSRPVPSNVSVAGSGTCCRVMSSETSEPTFSPLLSI